MKDKKIIMDFTTNEAVENQEIAIMPAGIAKLALEALAQNLKVSSPEMIIDNHISLLNSIKNGHRDRVEEAIKASLDFVNLRSLIKNVSKGNWDVYKT